MKFNINTIVRVRLTPAGRAFHAAQFAISKIRTDHGLTYIPPTEDAEGWSKWQLWSLMQEFGSECYAGNPGLPFATVIEIPDAKVTPT